MDFSCFASDFVADIENAFQSFGRSRTNYNVSVFILCPGKIFQLMKMRETYVGVGGRKEILERLKGQLYST